MRCYGNLTFVLANAGRYEDADRVAREGEDVCHRYGPMLSVASTIVNNHMSALIYLGRWEEARQLAIRALDEAMPEGIALSLHLTLAEIAAVQGDSADVDAQLAHATQLGPNDPYARSSVLTARAELHLWNHDPQAALHEVEAALPELQGQQDAVPVLNACWLGLRSAADLAEVVAASRGAVPPGTRHLIDLARATGDSTVPAVAALLVMCEAEASRGSGAGTDDDWIAAAEANEKLQRPYLHAYSMYRLAVCQLRRRALSAVVPTLQQSRELAEHLGCQPLVAACRRFGGLFPVRPHSTRAGGAARSGVRGDQPDRRADAIHQRADCGRAREQHPGQARRHQPNRGGSDRAPPGAGRSPGTRDRRTTRRHLRRNHMSGPKPVQWLPKPAGPHPCGPHPCVLSTSVVHGAQSRNATTTLCGRTFAAAPAGSTATPAVGTNCRTCVKSARKVFAAVR